MGSHFLTRESWYDVNQHITIAWHKTNLNPPKTVDENCVTVKFSTFFKAVKSLFVVRVPFFNEKIVVWCQLAYSIFSIQNSFKPTQPGRWKKRYGRKFGHFRSWNPYRRKKVDILHFIQWSVIKMNRFIMNSRSLSLDRGCRIGVKITIVKVGQLYLTRKTLKYQYQNTNLTRFLGVRWKSTLFSINLTKKVIQMAVFLESRSQSIARF